MGIKGFFLDCVMLAAVRYERRWRSDVRFRNFDLEVFSVAVLDGAWSVPEEAIPRHRPANAAAQYVEYAVRAAPVPDWLQAHFDAEQARGNVPTPF